MVDCMDVHMSVRECSDCKYDKLAQFSGFGSQGFTVSMSLALCRKS